MAQTVGMIGLGIMGRPMAKNLLKAGYPLVVHSRSRGPVQELVGAGAKAATSPKGVAGQVDVLISVLPNSPEVELVALGREGIIEGARKGLLYLDRSTLSPLMSHKVGQALGVPLPRTAADQELFNATRGKGKGGLDHSGVITPLEELAGLPARS